MPSATSSSVITALQKKLPRTAGDAFSLLSVPAEDVMTANIEAVRLLQSEGFSGVYVSLSKDYLSVAGALDESGVNLGGIRFVDAISRMYGIAPVETDDVVYVDGPLSGDALIAGIAASVHALKGGKRFVLLDSLTTILLYNSVEATAEFGRDLRNLLKKEGVACIVVVAYQDFVNQEIIGKISKNSAEIVSVGAKA